MLKICSTLPPTAHRVARAAHEGRGVPEYPVWNVLHQPDRPTRYLVPTSSGGPTLQPRPTRAAPEAESGFAATLIAL
jgi:hypothetical protein